MSKSKYRPEFGQYLSDKAYDKAVKLRALARHSRTLKGDADNAATVLANLLRSEPQPQAKQMPEFSTSQLTRHRSTAKEWVQHNTRQPGQRENWQRQSDQLHAKASAARWPTGPRPAARKRAEVPASDMGAVYIFFVLLIIYLILK